MHNQPPQSQPVNRPGFATTFTPKLISVLREGYGLQAFQADAVAGLTVAIVALPLSMALAIACGLAPERGLYAAIIGGFIISAFGGSRFQIGGPAGAFIVLIAITIERHGYEGLVLATMMAGVMMMLAGFLRLGSYIKYIPFPVTIGFTAGIAIIIFTSQLKELMGLDLAREPAAFVPKLQALWSALGTFKPSAIAIAALGMAIILALRRFRPRWPGFLIAILATSVLALVLGFDIATVGSRFGGIPNSLPAPSLPVITFVKMRDVLPDALAFALLGSIESLLSAVVADGMSGRRHRSNCELVAQGGANIATMLFGGMPVTGTIARTATNIRAGAHGPVSGMLHALYLLVFMLVAAPLATYIPLAALAAVLVVVSWNMAEKTEFVAILKASWGDALVLLATFLLTIFADLILAISVGVTLAALLFMHRMAEATGFESDDLVESVKTNLEQEDAIVVCKISGAFFFGSTSAVITALESMGQRPKAFVLDFTRVTMVDITSAKGLEGLIHKLRKHGTMFMIAGASPAVQQTLLQAGLSAPDVSHVSSTQEAMALLKP